MTGIDLAALTAWHGYQDSVRWRLTPAGVEIEGEGGARGTPGEPITVRRIWREYGPEIGAAAVQYGVPVELIVATIATESGGDALAMRCEPGFRSYDGTPNKVSVGLMQTLVSTAREALHDLGIGVENLRRPAVSIRAGSAYIAQQSALTGFDPPKVACAYNAGGVYRQDGGGNRWGMRQYPIGTGAHADRFVLWFNDCFAGLPLLGDDAMSFAKLLAR